VIFGVFLPQFVFAHARSTSYSTWEIAGNRVQVTVRVPVIELQRSLTSVAFSSLALQPHGREAEQQLVAYLTAHLRLFSGDQPCEPVPPGVGILPPNDPSRIIRTWRLICPTLRHLKIRNDAFFVTAPAHLHFARVRIDGAPVIEKLFAVHEREWFLAPTENSAREAGSRFSDYLRLGVTHIWGGVDHVVFLLALLLVAESLMSVAQIVTGFTVAHSVTLALGVLNVVNPSGAIIESLIGFSIALVAIENFWVTTREETRRWLLQCLMLSLGGGMIAAQAGFLRIPLLALVGLSLFSIAYLLLLHRSAQPQRLRWFIAFTFGFLHGFAFAGVLTELRLPTRRLAAALLGFNLGVELGQLSIVVLAWPFLTWLSQSRRQKTRVLTVQVGSAVILAAGFFWFVTRAIERP
jgi:hypothetical protein